MESGFKTGIYTSPYLQRFTERIKINDLEIPEKDITRLVTYIKPIIDRILEEGYEHPTEFEIITAIMFKYFNEENVDFAVLEVGLGGRLDSTNVITPMVSVITSISFDHMAVLGNTLGKIAYEKAGIIKQNGVVVSYPQDEEAFDVIKKVCIEKNARLVTVDERGINLRSYSMDGQVFDIEVMDAKYVNLEMKLIGEYQLLNAKTAITAVMALSEMGIAISKQSIYEGIKNVRWPGRLEVMAKHPVILLDGAHNLQGITSLKNAILKYFKYKRLILVMGVLKDKQVNEMCNVLMPFADAIITTSPLSERALTAEELSKLAIIYCGSVEVCPNIEEAYKKGVSTAKDGDLLLFCGSLYMIGYIRTLIESTDRY
jgi:dihydrofolate synthase/folylpolyglutamate synthase